MNKIPRPVHDDYDAMFCLVRNSRLKSFPNLFDAEATIIAAYNGYLANCGNASAIQSADIQDKLGSYLRGHYDSPPLDLAYIDEYRRSSAHKVCAMCGSFGSETLDHVLPRSSYPEFSVFVANLVPACPCNSLRSDTATGAAAGERVLHPYFDDCLADRLLVAKISPPFGEAPAISLGVCMDPTHPLLPAVNFHVRTIVLRTAILNHLDVMWANLWRSPTNIIPTLGTSPVSEQHIAQAIQTELSRLDDRHGSCNNWDSIFVAGLQNNQVITWLTNHVNQTNHPIFI